METNGYSPDRAREMQLATGLVVIHADALDDLEHARIAAFNRARALRDDKEMPELAVEQEALATAIGKLEDEAAKALTKTMKAHPLGPWVKGQVGLGERQVARLLGAIGDPAERYSNPAKLWAYCGFHVVDGKRPKHKRGVQSNWNDQAKSRAYLCATSCMKQRTSPYRKVYDRERERWADRDTSDLHKHNHALAVTAKAILLDLWVASRKAAGLPHERRDKKRRSR